MKHILFILLLSFTLTSPSFASEFYYREKYEPAFKNDKTYKEAKPIIQACWDISEELRSGTNHDMKEGHAKTYQCLEKEIKTQGEIIFQGKDMKGLTELYLEKLRTAQIGFEHLLYNENAACQPLCGSMWHVFPNNNHATLLEDILYKLIWVKQTIVIPNLEFRKKQPEFERIEKEYEEKLKKETNKAILHDTTQREESNLPD